ncbi:NusG domain II-containing protein [Fusobacterium mortiferum]|uniref:NusG domain II-containing protein n=1 Tax=Fusobacterium mortiferum TaxID=850 RepID=UPI001F17835C|nr:NusG domain II-containing protein [Fusobacterium mortiferum]MCF2699282.1 NusG domain II-containing protein [Fusobacterium mortiferum]
MRGRRYFRLGDLVVYLFFIIFFYTLGTKVLELGEEKPSKVEIYVDGTLKYIYPLQKEERDIFVDTVLGGVNVKFKDNMVRVTSSNSPKKINVKRGWISSPGEVIIGIPDRLLIKIVGDKKDEDGLDYIIR